MAIAHHVQSAGSFHGQIVQLSVFLIFSFTEHGTASSLVTHEI